MIDVGLVNGDLIEQNRWIIQQDRIIQGIEIRLGRFRGEWFLDPSTGLPWMEWLGQRSLNPNTVLSQVRAEILRASGVVGIDRLEFNRSGTSATIEADIRIETEDQTPTVLGISVSGTGRVVVL